MSHLFVVVDMTSIKQRPSQRIVYQRRSAYINGENMAILNIFVEFYL